ncbi:hypothetical protein D3C72_1320550 [compost metagenome]
MHQLQLTVTELEIGTAHILAPLMRLHNPGAVLTIRRARRARHIIHLLVVLARHTDRILRMTTNDHVQIAGRQAARHLNIARRVGAVIAVIVMAHVRCGDNHVRLFVLTQLLHYLFGFLCRNTELDVGKILRVANLGCVIRRQADDRNLDPLLVK